MTENLPDGMINAIELFDSALGQTHSEDRVRTFKNGVYLLNDSMEDFPSYKEHICHIKLTHTEKLLNSLKIQAAELEYAVWLEYILLFCIDLKQEIKALRTKDPFLFEFFLSFLDVHSKLISGELRKNISDFLEEIRL